MDVDQFIDTVVDIQAQDNHRQWTEEENNLLRKLHGYFSDEQIGEILGRSRVAVTLHWKRELHLPPPSRDPNYISCRRIADLLGVDAHVTPSWVDRGLLLGEYIPIHREQLWRRVRLDIFMSWILDPMNWIWFDIFKVKDPYLHKMLQEKQQAWGDEWWTTNQVAEHHGVNNKDVLRFINAGKVAAVQAHNRSGRQKDNWAKWFIRRSEATRPDLKFVHNKPRSGSSINNLPGSPKSIVFA